MAVENQVDSMFAENLHVLRWNNITEEGTGTLNLTGRVVKFSLTRLSSSGVPLATPLLSFKSTDSSPQVTVPNPNGPAPQVLVTLLPADTVGLAPKSTVYYGELEVYEGSAPTNPVVVATVLLTIKPNVSNP
jgi:hypothetical protein